MVNFQRVKAQLKRWVLLLSRVKNTSFNGNKPKFKGGYLYETYINY